MSSTIAFSKGHGTGNDFVIVADPDGADPLSAGQVAALCDRHFGIGGDGLLRVVRSSALAEGAATADAEWFMDYRNADGSIAEMCGNGIRVFARYLEQTGRAEVPDDGLRIGTRNGTLVVTAHERGYEVDLGAFTIDTDAATVRARGLPISLPGIGIDVGNPHVVVALPSQDELEALDLTVQPQLTPVPDAGANIEFVVPTDPLVVDGVGSIHMRVFERGVGETLSCGTGVAAAALAVREWAGEGAPDRWRVDVPGGTLGVRVAPVGDVPHVFLSGPARIVFSGEVTLA